MAKADFGANPEKVNQIKSEKTLVLIKPDAVARKIIGEIITRFEKKSLKIAGMKFVHPSTQQIEAHYSGNKKYLTEVGQKTYDNFTQKGLEVDKTPYEIGVMVRQRLIDSMSAGPIVALVLEGAHVVEAVRAMRGATSPAQALPGTIGFDYSLDSYELGDAGDWGVKNIIHASDSVENAKHEIGIWFKEEELVHYDTAECRVLYSKDWYKK